jgi:hypothetical protein
MKVMVNADGSTTVECNGSSVTINPPSPTDPIAGGPSEPGAVSAQIAARRVPAAAKFDGEAGAGAPEQSLILHGQGEIDVDRIRRMLDDAGLRDVAIEITPPTRDS